MSFYKFPQISIGVLIFIFIPLQAWGSILFLVPQAQDVWQGESFLVEVWLDTEGEIVNTVEGYLNFPQDKLEILDISVGGSILGLWPETPSYREGEVSFIGGTPKGFYGQGQLISITFHVLPRIDQRVSASISFKENSQVLLHDGKGTPTSLSFSGGNYEIIKKPENLPKITSSSHPDQNQWQKKNDFYLRWDLIEGMEYSYLLSHDPLAEPDEIPDTPEGELIWMGDMAYKGLEDGVYYFHLRQCPENGSRDIRCGPKISYRAMIDASPPEPFELAVTEIDGKNYLVFATTDKTSGIDFYEVKEGEEEWEKGKSPYLLRNQKLKSKILVRAVDKAGNEQLAELIPPPKKLGWKDLVISLAILTGLVITLWIIRKIQMTKSK